MRKAESIGAEMDLKERVGQVLNQHAAPALDLDGTQIEVLDVSDGIARLRLGGVCGGCPSSIMAAVMDSKSFSAATSPRSAASRPFREDPLTSRQETWSLFFRRSADFLRST
jgi:Fe-S cluster biogenesis protein NfuA